MGLNITLINNSDKEKKTKKQLEMLLEKYDLDKWIFQKSIFIGEREIPHSHPKLTINTFHLNNDNRLLSQFLHEQIHWFLPLSRFKQMQEELNLLFPQIEDEYHLIINYLEYDALRQLIGEREAKEIIDNKKQYMKNAERYTELYEIVTQQEGKIKEILEKHDLLI